MATPFAPVLWDYYICDGSKYGFKLKAELFRYPVVWDVLHLDPDLHFGELFCPGVEGFRPGFEDEEL